jgi:transposase-like protein
VVGVNAIEAELIKDGRKRDERGRGIVSQAERERLIAAYESSGLTQEEFARREGVKYATFTAWLGRRRRAETLGGPGVVTFQELLGGASPGSAGLEVRLADGTLVRGRAVREVVELVKALRR